MHLSLAIIIILTAVSFTVLGRERNFPLNAAEDVTDYIQNGLSIVYRKGKDELKNADAVLRNAKLEPILRRVTTNTNPETALSQLKTCSQLNIQINIIKPLTTDARIKVYLVNDTTTSDRYVWKTYQDVERYRKEATFLAIAKHPSIVKVACTLACNSTQTTYPGILIELVQGTQGSDHFDSRYPFASSEEIVSFAAKVYDAMQYIHWIGYSHGDLRTRHILRNEVDGSPRIIDYEEVVKLPLNTSHIPYAENTAPELVFHQLGPRLENVDMWMFGIALARWNYRKYDLNGWNSSDSASWRFIKVKRRGSVKININIPNYFSNELRQVLYYCWNPVPEMRVFNTQAQQTYFQSLPYWKGVDWNSLRERWDNISLSR